MSDSITVRDALYFTIENEGQYEDYDELRGDYGQGMHKILAAIDTVLA